MVNKILVLGLAVLVFFQLQFANENLINNSKEVAMKKVLVLYASKAGSTKEVAEFIGQEMTKSGAQVFVAEAEKNIDPSAYNAVIIGSPIYMGKWLSEARDYLKLHEKILKNKPTAIFFTCLSMSDPAKKNEAEKYLAEEKKLINPILVGKFAGKMDSSKLSFFYRMIAKIVGAKDGDFRDWSAIAQWSRDFYSKIM